MAHFTASKCKYYSIPATGEDCPNYALNHSRIVCQPELQSRLVGFFLPVSDRAAVSSSDPTLACMSDKLLRGRSQDNLLLLFHFATKPPVFMLMVSLTHRLCGHPRRHPAPLLPPPRCLQPRHEIPHKSFVCIKVSPICRTAHVRLGAAHPNYLRVSQSDDPSF